MSEFKQKFIDFLSENNFNINEIKNELINKNLLVLMLPFLDGLVDKVTDIEDDLTLKSIIIMIKRDINYE